MDGRAIFDRCSIPHLLSSVSSFPLPISYVYVSFRSSFAHFPLPMARPGGMRGAIEYGQPLAGLSRVKSSRRNSPFRRTLAGRLKAAPRLPPGRPRKTQKALLQTPFRPKFLHFPCILLYKCDMKPILMPESAPGHSESAPGHSESASGHTESAAGRF